MRGWLFSKIKTHLREKKKLHNVFRLSRNYMCAKITKIYIFGPCIPKKIYFLGCPPTLHEIKEKNL